MNSCLLANLPCTVCRLLFCCSTSSLSHRTIIVSSSTGNHQRDGGKIVTTCETRRLDRRKENAKQQLYPAIFGFDPLHTWRRESCFRPLMIDERSRSRCVGGEKLPVDSVKGIIWACDSRTRSRYMKLELRVLISAWHLSNLRFQTASDVWDDKFCNIYLWHHAVWLPMHSGPGNEI